jgi:hypothetical protein
MSFKPDFEQLAAATGNPRPAGIGMAGYQDGDFIGFGSITGQVGALAAGTVVANFGLTANRFGGAAGLNIVDRITTGDNPEVTLRIRRGGVVLSIPDVIATDPALLAEVQRAFVLRYTPAGGIPRVFPLFAATGSVGDGGIGTESTPSIAQAIAARRQLQNFGLGLDVNLKTDTLEIVTAAAIQPGAGVVVGLTFLATPAFAVSNNDVIADPSSCGTDPDRVRTSSLANVVAGVV